MSVSVGRGQTEVIVTWAEPAATDDSGDVVQITSSNPSGSYFRVGRTPVSYEFNDSFGNSVTCSFVVNVSGMV